MTAFRRFSPCPDCCGCQYCPPEQGVPEEIDVLLDDPLAIYDGHFILSKASAGCIWEYVAEDPGPCTVKRIRVRLYRDRAKPKYPEAGYALRFEAKIDLTGFDQVLPFSDSADYGGNYDDASGVFTLGNEFPAIIPTVSPGSFTRLNPLSWGGGYRSWLAIVQSVDPVARTVTIDKSTICGDTTSPIPGTPPGSREALYVSWEIRNTYWTNWFTWGADNCLSFSRATGWTSLAAVYSPVLPPLILSVPNP